MIWYFDSGASRHITSRKDLFCSLDAAPAGKKVTCANNASYPIRGIGKILITILDGSDLCLPDVLYVPGIKKNLLSVSSLAKNGLRVIFEDDRCIVRDRENGYSLITTGTLENGLFVLDRYEKQIQACIAETKTQAMQDAELWHARFGHVGYGSLMTLQRHNMVHDLSLLEMPPRHLVHSDVCGPMRTPSVGNSIYFVTFIDDFSRFCWVYPLKAKSDVFAIFQHYVSMVENETGCKVQTLRTDRGERKNRSLMEMARCMLKAKSLPHKLWMEAVACAAHVLNRCPTRALKTITPYESWYDKKPSVSYLRVFGCLAYADIPQQLHGKLDDKAVKCIFVGYSSGSKGYRLYNPATNKIFESRDVIFAKTTAQSMVAFDVPHMQTQDVFEGFLPSFVENQESQQVDNFDQSFDQHVTPHDVEEIVREEQEVLREERTLPKWVQKILEDSKLDAPLPRKTRAGTTFGREQVDFACFSTLCDADEPDSFEQALEEHETSYRLSAAPNGIITIYDSDDGRHSFEHQKSKKLIIIEDNEDIIGKDFIPIVINNESSVVALSLSYIMKIKSQVQGNVSTQPPLDDPTLGTVQQISLEIWRQVRGEETKDQETLRNFLLASFGVVNSRIDSLEQNLEMYILVRFKSRLYEQSMEDNGIQDCEAIDGFHLIVVPKLKTQIVDLQTQQGSD
ncbi:hypothetical protein L7F22_059803 [Adiantum nelumboides]|nr:hypothetical protein [Adiantum nelumboides]